MTDYEGHLLLNQYNNFGKRNLYIVKDRGIAT